MDSMQKMWMFQHWISEQKDQAELAKNTAYLLASFDHPESVKKMIEGPDFSSSDEDFEESMKIVREANIKAARKDKNIKKRKRKIIG